MKNNHNAKQISGIIEFLYPPSFCLNLSNPIKMLPQTRNPKHEATISFFIKYQKIRVELSANLPIKISGMQIQVKNPEVIFRTIKSSLLEYNFFSSKPAW